ncbi:MAG: DUF1648 domain-containing protein [Clostridium sp.]
MKEKMPLTKTQKLLEILSLTIMVFCIIYICTSWSTLPDILPSHFNALGQPNDWSGKCTVLVGPIISIIIYVLLTGCMFLPPEWMNSPIEVTPKNRLYIQKVMRDMVSSLKLGMVLIFSYITLCTIELKPLSPWFIPLFLLGTLLPLIVFIVKLFKFESKT